MFFVHWDWHVKTAQPNEALAIPMLHQTIIVLLGWWLLRLALPPLGEFAILFAATAAGCWLFYALGRRIDLLRPLTGLRRRAKPRAPEPPGMGGAAVPG